MKRKDFVFFEYDQREVSYREITAHTLERWLRKARRTQSRVHGCTETADHEQRAYDLARDIIRVLEKKK